MSSGPLCSPWVCIIGSTGAAINAATARLLPNSRWHSSTGWNWPVNQRLTITDIQGLRRFYTKRYLEGKAGVNGIMAAQHNVWSLQQHPKEPITIFAITREVRKPKEMLEGGGGLISYLRKALLEGVWDSGERSAVVVLLCLIPPK